MTAYVAEGGWEAHKIRPKDWRGVGSGLTGGRGYSEAPTPTKLALQDVDVSAERLKSFYEKYDQEKVAKVKKILADYSRAELVAALSEKYGANATEGLAQA